MFYLILYCLMFCACIQAKRPTADMSKPKLPAVLNLSIPKCGTNLISKLLRQLGFQDQYCPQQSFIHVLQRHLKQLKAGNFASSHFIADEQNIRALGNLPIKIIHIYRDPRDHIVSFAYYMKYMVPTWEYSDLSLEDIITSLIVDYKIYYTTVVNHWNDPLLKDLHSLYAFYNLYKGWHYHPNVYTTTFEKLVGSQGGGDDEQQYQEIYNIAQHLELDLHQDEIIAIQRDLFGDVGTTFRAGQIGSWRTHFTQQDKDLFKEVAGQLLIDLGYETDFDW